jgi:hypothetical protein
MPGERADIFLACCFVSATHAQQNRLRSNVWQPTKMGNHRFCQEATDMSSECGLRIATHSPLWQIRPAEAECLVAASAQLLHGLVNC